MGCVNCHQMDSIKAETPPKDPSDIRLIVANGQRKVARICETSRAKLSPGSQHLDLGAQGVPPE